MISFCPVCGKGVKGSFKFCPFCGNSLPVEEHAEAQTGLSPPGSSFQGSRRGLNSSPETSPKKVKWSPTVTSLPPSVPSGCGSSDSEESFNSPERATGTWSRPLTPRGSPQSSRRSPQTLKRSRVTTNLQALPTGTKLTDKKGQHWTLGALQTRDDQGILYEAEPTSALPCESRTEKYRFSLKLDSKNGRLFNEQNFFQRAAKPMQVNKWKKRCLVPLLAIPTCVGFGIHQDKYRFLVFPSLGRSLQSALDDNPKHVLSEKCVLQVACRLLDALEFIHENEYVHGNLTARNVFVNPRDLSQVTLMGYGFTFRYCPGGRHVTYKEGSRSPHEGDLEFVSVDIHKGCDESLSRAGACTAPGQEGKRLLHLAHSCLSSDLGGQRSVPPHAAGSALFCLCDEGPLAVVTSRPWATVCSSGFMGHCHGQTAFPTPRRSLGRSRSIWAALSFSWDCVAAGTGSQHSRDQGSRIVRNWRPASAT
ncbi:serine/threonine-protein kinase VRK3 isoform X2 [Alexandromys fortis]|uniref:serine/threonine-protein kinase VRK3 isoform X2 n=1 Tax=Alexandromys fortis TaxID=100897 RepID=UPI00215352E1|nr:inactive serine/threonine-protein kinase VRK3 isoform X2 [Microtus fortis]